MGGVKDEFSSRHFEFELSSDVKVGQICGGGIRLTGQIEMLGGEGT